VKTLFRGSDGVRRIITDKSWRRLQAELAGILSRRGAPAELDLREFVEAVLYIDRTGIPWRDLPLVFGEWSAVYMRFKRWRERGVWEKLWLAVIRPGAEGAGKLFVDSTIVRAHPHAAGGGLDADEAKGRSRGGYSTKIHLAVADEKTVLSVALTPGQAGDAPMFDSVMEGVAAHENPATEVVADRAYDSNAIRDGLADAEFKTTIPSRRNRTEPIPHDEESYKERNLVERAVGRLKRMRRTATRYDKLGAVFLAMVHLSCIANTLI